MFEVVFYSLLGGLISLVGALLLFRNQKQAKSLASYATPFAAGVLLATALIDLLPESINIGGSDAVFTWVLIGIVGFFLLERYVRVFHHHHEHAGGKAQNSLVIFGDTLHNALDGIAIGAAFLVDVPTGVVAALAVAAHEIPQEIGDFGILLKNGMEHKKVVLVNVISALATTATAIGVYAIGDSDSAFIPYVLALTAGFFIYIAASDIIPEIHQKTQKYDLRPWLLVLGAVVMMVVSPIAHDYIDAAHDHDHAAEEMHEDHEDAHAEDEHNHSDEVEHDEEADHHDE